jgi:hypothetical protein
MATRALTPVAQRRSRDNVSATKALGRGRDWRQLLLSQDAEAVWHELSILVRTAIPDHSDGYEHLTQELFLHLLTTNRVSVYIEEDYSDSEITEDLLSILCE